MAADDLIQKIKVIGQQAYQGKLYSLYYQPYLDRSVQYVTGRWIALGVLLFIFLLRVVLAQGWYIICYALGIYLLNLFLLFLQPKFDPSLEQEIKSQDIEEGNTDAGEGSSSSLDNDSNGDEFRPFIRRLPEFKFWYNAIRATTLGFVATWFEIFDVPVFWPILLIYFIVLFTLTMRRQIQHMIKYKYLPFDLGKTKYGRS
ncbi:hypothetical protein D0Z00_003259 [Geotrichum galactomycetum]|uniref:Uncharacterized protein n=1 Tax=Geotrichum galactomycetum TaxID=27317 RepID=A0ACB6V1T0_9ASCO|nr:hypothetical protein D0Z00_003259 [Geotrichum candidum]